MLFYLEVDILYWFNTFPNFLDLSLDLSVRQIIISNYFNIIKNSATVEKNPTNKPPAPFVQKFKNHIGW